MEPSHCPARRLAVMCEPPSLQTAAPPYLILFIHFQPWPMDGYGIRKPLTGGGEECVGGRERRRGLAFSNSPANLHPAQLRQWGARAKGMPPEACPDRLESTASYPLKPLPFPAPISSLEDGPELIEGGGEEHCQQLIWREVDEELPKQRVHGLWRSESVRVEVGREHAWQRAGAKQGTSQPCSCSCVCSRKARCHATSWLPRPLSKPQGMR